MIHFKENFYLGRCTNESKNTVEKRKKNAGGEEGAYEEGEDRLQRLDTKEIEIVFEDYL